jgi:hypothetical protein
MPENANLTELTPWQKLSALAMRFYGNTPWTPKPGDYYSTSRADLELYQVVDIKDDKVYTRYCDPQKGNTIADWPVDEFLSPKTFGYARVWVHEAFLQPHPNDVHYKPGKAA